MIVRAIYYHSRCSTNPLHWSRACIPCGIAFIRKIDFDDIVFVYICRIVCFFWFLCFIFWILRYTIFLVKNTTAQIKSEWIFQKGFFRLVLPAWYDLSRIFVLLAWEDFARDFFKIGQIFVPPERVNIFLIHPPCNSIEFFESFAIIEIKFVFNLILNDTFLNIDRL